MILDNFSRGHPLRIVVGITMLAILLAGSAGAVINPGFESGTSPWVLAPPGDTLTTASPGFVGINAVKLVLNSGATNIQFYQRGIILEPNTPYRLSFAAYSTTGHDMTVRLIQHVSPYAPYAPSFPVNLGTNWHTFTTEFTTNSLATTSNGRLQFLFGSYAKAGDTYYIDDIRLEKFSGEPDTTPPNITFWYGNSQMFGELGVPQQWVNILGNAYDTSGIDSMNYSLNNGSVKDLSIGLQNLRLSSIGDFNIEINYTDLLCADNQVMINATDNKQNTRSEIVFIDYSCNNVWPEDYAINWSKEANIQDVAQVVDGLWTKETNDIHPAIIGYDRLIAIGDMTWTDYEVTVPITINTPLDPSAPSGGPNFGISMRWQGHNKLSGEQPGVKWWPIGAIGGYMSSGDTFRLLIIGRDENKITIIANDTSGRKLTVGVPYMFKMRAKTNGTRTQYFLKVWNQGTTEPAAWTISGYGDAIGLEQGSAMLNSHYSNVSFGNVTIRSLDGGAIISDISVETHENNATVRWLTDKPASSNVSYGSSTNYENGSVVDGTLVLSHAILLNDLKPGTLYHYKINSIDNGGKSTNSVDLHFTTIATILPSITVQPVDKTAINGSKATFSVEGAGTLPLSYQWKKNDENITDATGPSYLTPATNLSDNGTKYSVLVSNIYGSVTSNEVTLFVIEATLPSEKWWDTTRNFRIPVTIDSTGFERYEKPVDVSINFTQTLGVLGNTGTFDETSIRVVESDINGVILSDTVPFQFDKDTGFNAATKASGTIVFMMNGTTQANKNRYYHVYFGLTGISYSSISVPSRVTLIDNVMDEGQSSYQISAGGTTYYFHKKAGGFSSLVDSSGNDWISYHPTVGSQAAGEFRGIPNVISGTGVFHPGFTCCTSSVVTSGPLKIRTRSVSPDGKWESLWDFYPGYATMTMVKAPLPYWWLYEGTPGGSLDPNSDFTVRSDNKKALVTEIVTEDIPTQEWEYFSDPIVNRSLFVSHHEDDGATDTSKQQANQMNIFGFGRDTSLNGSLSGIQHFTMGLMEGTEFAPSSKTIYSAYKDLGIVKGPIEQYDSASPPIIVTQPAARIIVNGSSATFNVSATGQLPLSYQWQKNNVNISGAINASYTISPVNLSNDGSTYRVVVTNTLGHINSNTAKLTVLPEQLVMLDLTYTFNSTKQGFSANLPFPPNMPSNLITPIDYAHGWIYQKLEVQTKPTTKPVIFQMCIFQDEKIATKHACTAGAKLTFTTPGTYYADQSMPSLYQYGNLQWNRSLLTQIFAVKDGNAHPIDNSYYIPGEARYFGYPDLSFYFPMQVRYTAIIVRPGGGAPVWPLDNPPSITSQPANKTIAIGETAIFSVGAAGIETLYYQWQKNGVNIDGAYSSSFVTPPATSADSGTTYRVIVTNEQGSVTSKDAILTVVGTINLIANPGFEFGTTTTPTSWTKVTGATYSALTPGYEGTRSAKLVITNTTANLSFYQTNIPLETGRYLEPNTRYRLSFSAYSSTGHDMMVNLVKSTTPYPTYGLSYKADLGTAWQNFSTEFNTTGFTTRVKTGRLLFVFTGTGLGTKGDIYYLDNVKLEKYTTSGDTTPPTVIVTTPPGEDVSYATQVTVKFSESMNRSSAQNAFLINPASTGNFSWNGNEMIYIPDLNLENSTIYNVTIGIGASDLAGNSMVTPYEWQFTTKEQDLTPPTVIDNSPNGMGVSLSAKISVNFSEAMNQSSVRSSFSTIPATNGSFGWIGNNMTYIPDLNFLYNTTYNVIIDSSAMDLADNSLSSYDWNFTTIPDIMAPSVIGNAPNGTNVPNSSQITVNFSEAMDQESVESAFFTSPVTTGSFSWNGNSMKYTPSNLSYNTTYNVTIGTGAMDLAGNNMSAPYQWQFVTAPLSINIISNPGFELGTTTAPTSWTKSTGVTLTAAPPAYEGTRAAKLVIGTTTTNLQFYQANIPLGLGLYLEPNTHYRLSFVAYSSTGHDMRVKLIKHVSPYTNYGVDQTFNLNTDWQTFSTEFTTSGFTTNVKNGRLQFFLTGTGLGVKGDVYYIDSVKLEKI